MKRYSIKKCARAVLPVLLITATGLHASVESDVKSYLQANNPDGLNNYPGVFEYVYSEHAPVIKESTYATVLHYYDNNDSELDHQVKLANLAVAAAIAKANAEMASNDNNEDKRGFYVTDAVCGAFKGSLSASFKQTTAAWKTVEGAMQAAIARTVRRWLAPRTIPSWWFPTCRRRIRQATSSKRCRP